MALIIPIPCIPVSYTHLTAPTHGGDPIANPYTLPTGRNMYAINAEATPTESADVYKRQERFFFLAD